MQIIQGTTPQITINVKSEIDLNRIKAIWIYMVQGNQIKIDKKLSDISFNEVDRQIIFRLSQEDTLGLKEGDAIFQIRLLMDNDDAYATVATKIKIIEIYKGGVISE